MIQKETHECEKQPKVIISRIRIDGEWTSWTLNFGATSREGSIGGTLNDVKYCPYCGERLDG